EVRRFGLRVAVERAWHALGGPATLEEARDLDELSAYFDALGELEEDTPGSPVDLARLEEALAELYAPARSSPDIRVELLTIHRSKGLQFDTVIVPALDLVGRSNDPPLLEWLKWPTAAGRDLVIAPIAAVGADERNPLHAWLGRLEREKLLQEKRRLLYVAATRAERHLHLFGACAVELDKKTGDPKVRAPRESAALGLLWVEPSVREAFAARLAEADGIEGEEPMPIPRDPQLLRLPLDWRVPTPPDGPAIAVRQLRRSAGEASVEFDWASETARHVGTVVHRELQRLARRQAGLPGGGPAAVEALRLRYATELAELGVPQERRVAAATRVIDAVERTLADERGRWLLHEPHIEAQSEAAFSGRLGSEVVSVVIDRTFIDARGTRWIVDYKTSTHEGTGLEEFLDNERERYRPQLERYAALLRSVSDAPIRLGLYFPLLSAWREWEAPRAVR
ncbi:MAG: 3'-5' exonuclease, partial [Steroidobacteraceae bacterium]